MHPHNIKYIILWSINLIHDMWTILKVHIVRDTNLACLYKVTIKNIQACSATYVIFDNSPFPWKSGMQMRWGVLVSTLTRSCMDSRRERGLGVQWWEDSHLPCEPTEGSQRQVSLVQEVCSRLPNGFTYSLPLARMLESGEGKSKYAVFFCASRRKRHTNNT